MLAVAYLIFAQIGSPNQDKATQGVEYACGSGEAAGAYLAQVRKGLQ